MSVPMSDRLCCLRFSCAAVACLGFGGEIGVGSGVPSRSEPVALELAVPEPAGNRAADIRRVATMVRELSMFY